MLLWSFATYLVCKQDSWGEMQVEDISIKHMNLRLKVNFVCVDSSVSQVTRGETEFRVEVHGVHDKVDVLPTYVHTHLVGVKSDD